MLILLVFAEIAFIVILITMRDMVGVVTQNKFVQNLQILTLTKKKNSIPGII